jgi:hypothetical protein
VLEVENGPMRAGDIGALTLTFGEPKPGATFAKVRRRMRETPGSVAIRGLDFRGLDYDVFTFGTDMGVRVSRRGIDFLRARPFINGAA